MLQRAILDNDWEVRRSALEALVRDWKQDSNTKVLLNECARSDGSHITRRAALQQLIQGWGGRLGYFDSTE